MDKLVSFASLFLSLVTLKVVFFLFHAQFCPFYQMFFWDQGSYPLLASHLMALGPQICPLILLECQCLHLTDEVVVTPHRKIVKTVLIVSMKIPVWNKTKTIYKPCYVSGHFSQFNEPLKHTLTAKQRVKYQLVWFPLFVKHNFSQVLKGGNKLIKYPFVTMCLKWSLFYQFW